MSKAKRDHIIWLDGEPVPCTKTEFDAHTDNRPMKYRFEFVTGNAEVPSSFVVETDAALVAFLKATDETMRRGDRAESRRHESLDDLTDHSRHLRDTSVDVAANAMLGMEISDLLRALPLLPKDEQELIQRLKLDDPPMSVADFAKMKGVTTHIIKHRTARVKEKIAQMIKNNFS